MERHGEGASPRDAFQGLALITAILVLPATSPAFAWLHGLIPVVVATLLVTFGRNQGAAVVAAALVMASAAAFGLTALPTLLFAITLLPAGYLLARGIETNEPPGRTGLKAAISLGTIWLLAAVWYGVRNGMNPYDELRQGLELGFQQTLEYYRGKTELPAEALKELTVALEATRRFLHRALPAVLVTAVVTTVWLNMVAACWLLRKTRPELVRWPEFKTWRLPELLVWPVIIALGLMASTQQTLVTVGINAAYVLGMLYFMQGLAITAHLLARWNMPRFFRGMVYVLLLIQLYGMLLLAVIGLVDTWFPLRKEQTPPAETEQ